MDAEKHAAAVEALTDLIRAEIDSTDPQRYARVERLSKIAQRREPRVAAKTGWTSGTWLRH